MSTTTDSKDFSVSKVVEYSTRYSQNMRNSMSVLTFNTNWLNRFSEFEGAVRFLQDTHTAIEMGLIDLSRIPEDQKDKIKLDYKLLYEITKIWNGGCSITRKRDNYHHTRFIKDSEVFHYDNSKIDFDDPFLEIIPLPSLDNMTPIGRVRDETLLIQITANIPLYLAYEAMDYDTLIREGGLFHYENGNLLAKFGPQDMDSKLITTYKVGRSYYFKTMDILKNKFFDKWKFLKVDLHNLMVYKEIAEQVYDTKLLAHLTSDGIPTPGEQEDLDADRPFNFETDIEAPPTVRSAPKIRADQLSNISDTYKAKIKEANTNNFTKSDTEKQFVKKIERLADDENEESIQ